MKFDEFKALEQQGDSLYGTVKTPLGELTGFLRGSFISAVGLWVGTTPSLIKDGVLLGEAQIENITLSSPPVTYRPYHIGDIYVGGRTGSVFRISSLVFGSDSEVHHYRAKCIHGVGGWSGDEGVEGRATLLEMETQVSRWIRKYGEDV